MPIIHLNHHLSNEKTLKPIWASSTAVQMTKWLHQSSNLSVLKLTPDMGEYNSPLTK